MGSKGALVRFAVPAIAIGAAAYGMHALTEAQKSKSVQLVWDYAVRRAPRRYRLDMAVAQQHAQKVGKAISVLSVGILLIAAVKL